MACKELLKQLSHPTRLDTQTASNNRARIFNMLPRRSIAPRRNCWLKWQSGCTTRRPSGRLRNRDDITCGGSIGRNPMERRWQRSLRLKWGLRFKGLLLSTPTPAMCLYTGWNAFFRMAWLP